MRKDARRRERPDGYEPPRILRSWRVEELLRGCGDVFLGTGGDPFKLGVAPTGPPPPPGLPPTPAP